MLKILAALFFCFFSLFHIPLNARQPISLTVNIISHSLQNGAGKEVDVSILKGELEKFGHRVNLFDYFEVKSIAPADINIFLAQFKSNWFPEARLNWFIPNAECCVATLNELQQFDLILCKTKASLEIYRKLCEHTYYLGFTSIDRHQPSVVKDFSMHLHVAGKSRMKGTDEVLKAWKSHPGLPNLIVIKHKHEITEKIYIPKNVKLITKRIPNRSLLTLQNQCGVHLCPSKTEGFGHYLMEAMSAEAVILTTDAPPMNEFIKDRRCLVKYSKTGKKKYATTYTVDDQDLARKVKALRQLSYDELQRIGQHNREEYLRRAEEFKQDFETLLNKTVHELYPI